MILISSVKYYSEKLFPMAMVNIWLWSMVFLKQILKKSFFRINENIFLTVEENNMDKETLFKNMKMYGSICILMLKKSCFEEKITY